MTGPGAVGSFDVIIIGGGPSGATLAALLARGGKRTLLLEKERFPRFHIGESLLPCVVPLLAELGVLAEVERRFLRKEAAEFVTADGSFCRRYGFDGGLIGGPSSAFEVDRSEFDRLLLDNAIAAGAEVREGHQVVAFEVGSAGVEVTARDEGGRQELLRAAMLVDASGQQSLLAGRFGLRRMDPALRNVSVFSHYTGAERHTGPAEGDISIVLVPEGWWWVIPLRDDRTSVGLVAPVSMLRGKKPDGAFFLDRIANTPYLRQRLAKAERSAPVRTISDWSYASERLAGDRWLLVGDAGTFIDPVFSTGVYLGILGAFRAATAIERAFERQRFGRREFLGYERAVQRGVGAYRRFVRGFYHPAFVELLLRPSDVLSMRGAVTSLLAGYGADRFAVTWRVFVFHLLARLNRRLSMAPRLPGRREAYAQRLL
ncbi:MAG TPA: NAD(P)/FAD-dependent oxidoreductase [Polyangiaceae bacterium]|nr:NAD(P)/FAD-dependent oxidoreductase [Polyangiaceae bacterium]